MIKKIRIVNFRQIKNQDIDLYPVVVIIGPNNGGKTTLLQAISLFATALRFWGHYRINKKSKASKRTGVAINLDELLNIPISEFKELWKDLCVRLGGTNEANKPITRNVQIQICAEGSTYDEDSKEYIEWKTGFEFDYGRDTIIYTRLTRDDNGNLYEFPEILLKEKIGYLPSVASLGATEDKLEIGSILRNIGNGKTSDVLRNICYLLYSEDKAKWDEFVKLIESIFRFTLNSPVYTPVTGLITMSYNEGSKKKVDLSSLGSGSKQAILLFAYLFTFPNTVSLLDEPDAHLEVIRQLNIYDKITDLAKKNNSQIIIASHSESVLDLAFRNDKVLSSMFGIFEPVNQTKRIASVLGRYGYEQYLIAKQNPYMFYYEGRTDWDFIKAFANKFKRSELLSFLERSIYSYPIDGNNVAKVKHHFSALKTFIHELTGFALFDNLEKNISDDIDGLKIVQWQRKEIENYLPLPQTLIDYAHSLAKSDGDLLAQIFSRKINKIITDKTPPSALRSVNDNFWKKTKISDDYLTPILESFFDQIKYPRSTMDKSKFYLLVEYSDANLFGDEVVKVLSMIENHLMQKNIL